MVATTWVLGPSHPETDVQETQYEVVTEITGVTKGEPEPNKVPPEDAEYQFKVPVQPEASRVTDAVPHADPSIGVGATGIAFTVAVTGALGPSQPFTVHET